MGQSLSGFTDPFGAQEIYVDGVAYRERVGTEFVRSAFYASERGERIIRVKLIIPVAICFAEHQAMHNFIAAARGAARLVS